MHTQFNSDRHCGAIEQGKPCLNLKGQDTDHPGQGRCRQHGGASTGPKTAEGKAKSAQNSRKHGLYATVLSGSDRTRLALVQEYDPSEILRDNFFLVQSRVLGLLEGDTKFSKEAQVLKQACEVLVENGELSEEFAKEVLFKLANIDLDRLSRVLNSTVNLANAATFLDRMGDARRQLSICMSYLRSILHESSDRAVKTLVITAFQELKLDAGLPVDEIDELLAQFKQAEEVKEAELEAGDDVESDDDEELAEQSEDIELEATEPEAIASPEALLDSVPLDDDEDYWAD